MKTPIMIINFKTYKETTGERALKVALAADKAAKETGKSIAIAVQAENIRMISEKVSIPVLAEHVDDESYGAHTGSIIPESIKASGAVGSLINHAEKEISDEEVEITIKRCKELGLVTVVCANTKEDSERLCKYHPDFIAVEPPELIGGDISVSTAQPEVVSDTVKLVTDASGVPVLCGAGVKTKEDISKALELGAKGVLLASGVDKADDPYTKIMELLEGM